MTLQNKQPHQYENRILLVVVGMTPQVVTETLYKLAVQQQPAYIPTEVHLITTQEGASSATLALLGIENKQGWFQQLVQDYQLPNIQFSVDNIHIIKDTEGQFIDDNESSEHNRIAADFITHKIKAFTQNKDSALHVSLAGGRKTMSYYAGYALSLYGRNQDRLSHVLVDKNFQNNANFFYPPAKPIRIEINNHYYNTDDARIILSDIPYVRMQQHIPKALLDGNEGFNATVEKIQLFSGPSEIHISLSDKALTLNGVSIDLKDKPYAVYVWLCQRKKMNKSAVIFDDENYFSEFKGIFSNLFGEHDGGMDSIEDRERAIKTSKNPKEFIQRQKAYFRPHFSKIKGVIEQQLGEKFAQPFLIQSNENNNTVSYQISLEANAIHITQ